MMVQAGTASRLTHHKLSAAFHVAQVVAAEGCTEARLNQQYPRIATGGIHGRESFKEGQRLLEAAALLVSDGDLLIPDPQLLRLRTLPPDAFVEALLYLWLTKKRELWLAQLAGEDNVEWTQIPEDVHQALCSTFDDEGARIAFVLSAAQKVDQDALNAFGALGEEAVVRACQDYLRDNAAAHLVSDVVRVSLGDDTLGYDVVSPDLKGKRHRMEVKATSAPPGWVEFYVSRNEASVGARDPMWALVVAKRQIVDSCEPQMEVLGWLDYIQFSDLLPIDSFHNIAKGPSGRWSSCRVTLPDHLVHPGLPLDQRG